RSLTGSTPCRPPMPVPSPTGSWPSSAPGGPNENEGRRPLSGDRLSPVSGLPLGRGDRAPARAGPRGSIHGRRRQGGDEPELSRGGRPADPRRASRDFRAGVRPASGDRPGVGRSADRADAGPEALGPHPVLLPEGRWLPLAPG